jgi:uncharacterized protein (UPF0276 family)
MSFRPKRLGPGAVYLRGLDQIFRANGDLIKVAEVEPQTLWTKGTAPDASPHDSTVELQGLKSLSQRKLTHGVGYPLGGTICDQEEHVALFRRWTRALASSWTSEHLSVLHVKGAGGTRSCGFLMPPLQTDAEVDLATNNIRRRAAALGQPLAFETGVNYFPRQPFEMPDGEFFAAIAEAADCGILLDLTNLWVNHKNGRAKIGDVLARLPLDRIWEVHVAGAEFAHGRWLDAHSGGVDPELLAIAAETVADLPNLGAIIFEIAPDHFPKLGATAFLREIELINRLWDVPRRSVAAEASRPVERTSAGYAGLAPQTWENILARGMLPVSERIHDAATLAEQAAPFAQGLSLYAELAASFRRGAIADLLKFSTRLLLITVGEQKLREYLTSYMSMTPPSTFPSDEALGFKRYVDVNPPPVPGLKDLIGFEASLVEAAADSRTIEVTVRKDIETMISDIVAGRAPGAASDCPPTVLEIAVDPVPSVREQ